MNYNYTTYFLKCDWYVWVSVTKEKGKADKQTHFVDVSAVLGWPQGSKNLTATAWWACRYFLLFRSAVATLLFAVTLSGLRVTSPTSVHACCHKSEKLLFSGIGRETNLARVNLKFIQMIKTRCHAVNLGWKYNVESTKSLF